MILDELAPTWDVRSYHSVWIACEPGHVYQTVRTADLGGSWPVRLLMAIRGGPAAIVMWLRGYRPSLAHGSGLRTPGGAAFTLVAEKPGEELVLGLMGRFWTLNGGLVRAGPEEFRKPALPGLAQAFWNFRVLPSSNGTELSTETRVRCGDAATRRRFLRYWRIVQPGSGWIRWSILRQVRRAAERHARRVYQ
jgi:hypothetical protein